MRSFVLAVLLLCWPLGVVAEGKLVRFFAPEALVSTGLMRHMLPRFTLKTQVRVEVVASARDAQVTLGADGFALFQGAGGGAIWRVSNGAPNDPHAKRFDAWLRSDVGLRTILSFAPNETPLFSAVESVAEAVEVVAIEGDAALGHRVAVAKCGRCHAADETGRMSDIGSTPSFFMLRSLSDWQDRFSAFFALNPHPSFTQVQDVTAPFAIDRPPPIVPVEMTLDEVEAIVAYVSTLKAADLGAPLQHQ